MKNPHLPVPPKEPHPVVQTDVNPKAGSGAPPHPVPFQDVSPLPLHNEDEDRKTLARVANGDRQALRDLHDSYAGLVFTTVFRVMNDREDAEDITQEVFFLVWNKARLYNADRGKVATWLATLARNRAIDVLRTKQRRARLKETYDSLTVTEFIARTDRTVEEYAHACDEQAILRRAVVEALSDDQRQAIELAYFGGLQQKEIAEQLGTPVGTVKARIRRGLARLREEMAHMN